MNQLGNLTFTNSACNYFCSGFYAQSGYATVVVFMTSGTYFLFSNNQFIDQTQPNGNNIYQPTTRFISGNPFITYPNINVGYLSQIWISGLQGSTYSFINIRNNILNGFPIGARISSADMTALTQNDVGPIKYNDSRVVLREIQISNSPLLEIKGNIWDMRSGSPQNDYLSDQSMYCNGMCPIDAANTYCKVGTFVSDATDNSVAEFSTISSALQYCPFNRILLVDAIYTENIIYGFANERLPFPSTTLLLLSVTQSIIYGTHVFTSSCPTGTQTIPANFILQGITFMYIPITGGSLISFVNGGCPSPNIDIDKNTFNINSTANSTTATIISCVSCYVNFFNVTNNVFNNIQSNSITAVDFEPNTLGGSVLVVYNSYVSTPIGTFIYILNTQGFIVNNNYINCIDQLTSCILVDGSNLLGSLFSIYTNTITGQSNINPVNYTGLWWNLNQALTLSDVGTITNNIYGNTISGNALGVVITTSNMMDYYPCVVALNIYIEKLAANNPQVSATSHRFVFAEPDLGILAYVGKRTQCLIFDTYSSKTSLMLVAFILFGVFASIFLFFIICCGGINCLLPTERWVANYTGRPINDPSLYNKKNV